MRGDTTGDAELVRRELYRRTTPERRCEIAAEMSADIRAVALAGIRSRHPEYDDEQARLALFRMLVGAEVFDRVWPGAAALEP